MFFVFTKFLLGNFDKPLDFSEDICYNSTRKLNILIKSGGGTGPMKPDNLQELQGVKSCR